MEPNSPEHFGWSAMCREADNCFPTREAFMKGLAAYESARPKSIPITGLPEALPDGTPIVGWKWGMTEPGDWHMSPLNNGMRKTNFGGYLRVVAITEADNG